MRAWLVAAMMLAIPATGSAQAWTHPAGSGYLNLTLTGVSGNRIYNPDFTRTELPTTYSQLLVGLYGEIGIVDRVTVTFSSELLRRATLADQGRTLGLGDSKVGVFVAALTEPFRITAGIDVGLPTGDQNPQSDGDVEAQQVAASLPTGDGEFDVEPKILLGYSVSSTSWPVRHYFTASLGYQIRTSASIDGERQSFADAISYSLEVGTKVPISFLERIWFTARFFGVESFASNEESARGAVGLGNGVTYTSLGFGIQAEVYAGFGVMLQADLALRARSIISAIPVRGGISYEF